jgi:tetratricopeptide (TPR) repeat protein
MMREREAKNMALSAAAVALMDASSIVWIGAETWTSGQTEVAFTDWNYPRFYMVVIPPTVAGPPLGGVRVIADHEWLQPIASGSYGEVWLARSAVGTLRAVKLVRRDHFERAEEFEREFKGLQRFEPVSRGHEGLVDILQIGRPEDAGWFYYVMELADSCEGKKVEGGSSLPNHPPLPFLPSDLATYSPRTLRAHLRARGALPADDVIALGRSLTSALAYLHRRGLVHRDIKPSNILFVGGVPKLADAGLVAAMDDARSMVGTAGYIAPEGQGRPQSDLYALGKVLYEAAFGKDRQDFPQLPSDLATRHDHARLLEINAVIAAACAHNPKQRYASAAALLADLDLLGAGGSVKRRRTRIRAVWACSAGLLALGLGTALWFGAGRVGRRVASDSAESLGTTNLQARRLYLQGTHLSGKGPLRGMTNSGRQYFLEAVGMDPNFARAYAAIAQSYVGGQDRADLTLLYANAEQALRLDSNSWLAMSALAHAAAIQEWNLPKAESLLRRSIQLAPPEERATGFLARVLSWREKTDEALLLARLTVEQRPTGYWPLVNVGLTYRDARLYTESIEVFHQVTALYPEVAAAWMHLGGVHERAGQIAKAAACYQQWRRLEGDSEGRLAELSRQCDEVGLSAYWIQDCAWARQLKADYFPALVPAEICVGAGRMDEALDWCERAVKDRWNVGTLRTDPFYDPIRGHPRFIAVLTRLAELEATAQQSMAATPGVAPTQTRPKRVATGPGRFRDERTDSGRRTRSGIPHPPETPCPPATSRR